jgi:hypothetical protein
MTDDLVKRLRETTHMYQVDCELKMKCAARIEELEAENRRLKAEIESMRAERLERDRTTIAKLTGGKDE